MKEAVGRLEAACRLRQPVLLVGEPGTGKQFLARVAQGTGHRGAFLVLNASTASEEEAKELLAPWAGRETTVYVREAWANPPFVDRLLRWTQGRPLLHVCLGSTVPVADPVLGRLRPALGRAAVIPVPPLRERGPDLPSLVRLFLAEPHGHRSVTPRAMDLLARHHWPFNVSELKRVCWHLAIRYPAARTIDRSEVERALAASDTWLDGLSFDQILRAKLARFLQRVTGYEMARLRQEVLDEVDRHLLELALAATRWNKLQAARLLGMSRNTLRRRLQDLGIRPQP